jgi:coenzyme F420 hydrogenase subunit beta
MRLNLLDINDVAEAHLCCGCGACAYVSPEGFRMMDVPDDGCRPEIQPGRASALNSMEAIKACPGLALEHTFDESTPGLIEDMADAWGPVMRVWEGYATDGEIRFSGSSGGAATALALYCLEKGGMHGVLHIAARPDIPYLNRTVLSRSRAEMRAATGSRYAPASPCDGLQMVEDASGPCVFIGKPCDVAGTNMAAQLRPRLKNNLGLTIAIFCAGTPSTKGTLEMLRRMGIEDPAALVSVRYRGNGWPGKATAVVRLQDGWQETRQLSYEQSWGEVLAKHVQWRCRLCPDHTGEFADIAVGDPWHKPPVGDEPGRSLIVARTQRGRQIVENAILAGYLAAEVAEARSIALAQPNLLKVRAHVWGRIMVCWLMGVPAPRYIRMPLFIHWLRELSLKEKIQSLLGTVRRIIWRGLWRRTTAAKNPQALTTSIGAREEVTSHG